MSKVQLTVNGKQVSAEVEDRTLLVHLLRDHLNLTGTHVGCDTSQCGACVVHVDGRAVKSCTVLAGQADGSSVTTIEGIAGCSSLPPAMPSIVVTLAPAAWPASTVHDFTARPSTCTTQAPHWLVSQPTCVPVRFR